ncbi:MULTISPECIES: triose-phosphate isomerase [Sphingobium]|uniref:Triosephosphate isomerase n=2 Tax=Sphingobium cupriresistens TaxID=1132417 RepID=A0A0J7XV84_9SPHN|nr:MULTISPECIES: triose-phosphate isomerase [Sphingobium]KMS55517.1 triosephosphate isomerase [Sphingobium cupriresistens LL01]MBJ7378345.1 triose-phosphate isomerase [Sphingobium sp.]RYM13165.1 triose-phosphate isomerase [Sphingobium cupriresistens]WCP12478.1 Triosephosphate isomerase [Sphingobium sp. AntQ-1]
MDRRKLVVGNWKMNGLMAQLGEVAAIGALAADHGDVEVGLCLPATLIAAADGQKGGAFIGAQDCHMQGNGAHTGCLSAAMLAEAGASWTIVGHSERRQDQGESDADVAAKAMAARAAGLNVILCVGESLDVRDAGDAEAVVSAQLLASLPDGASADWLAVAYEPIWAIGTGRIPTMEAVATMHAALRAALASRIGGEAGAMRILYGGSMNGENAAELLGIADVDGGLVGGASLTAAKFAPIVAAADGNLAVAA